MYKGEEYYRTIDMTIEEINEEIKQHCKKQHYEVLAQLRDVVRTRIEENGEVFERIKSTKKRLLKK